MAMTSPRPLAGNSWRPGGNGGGNGGTGTAGTNGLQASIDALTRAVTAAGGGLGGPGAAPGAAPAPGTPPVGGNYTFSQPMGGGLLSNQRGRSAVRVGAAGYMSTGWTGALTGAAQGYATSGSPTGNQTLLGAAGGTAATTMNRMAQYGQNPANQQQYTDFDYYAQMTQMGNGNRAGGTTTYRQNLSALTGTVNSGARYLGARSNQDLINAGFAAQNLGFTQSSKQWGTNMSSYSAMALMNPNMGMQDIAQYQQTLTSRGNFWQAQMMGLGTNLNKDGTAKDPMQLTGQLINNQMLNPNRKLSADDVAKMTSNTSNLRQTFSRMGISGDQFDNMVKPYLSGLQAAEQSGMNQSQYQTLYEQAGQGNKDALGKLKKAGVTTDTIIQSQKNVQATGRTRTGDLTDDFAGGLKKGAEGLDKFNSFMNNFLKIPGVQRILGNTSGLTSDLGNNSKLPLGAWAGRMLGIGGGASGAGAATAGGSQRPTGSASATGAAAVGVAEKYLGWPYIYGADNPSQKGFDCSGLTQWAYGQIGVNLPRVAADQQKASKRIDKNSAQVGDLLFLGQPAHHVMMYMGNNKAIEAPHTGDVVKEIPVNLASVTNVGRVVDAAGILSQTNLNNTTPSQATLNGAARAGAGGNSGSMLGVSTEEVDAIQAALNGNGVSSPAAQANSQSALGKSGDVTQTGSMQAVAGNLTGSAAQNRALAIQMAQAYGWTGAEAEDFAWLGQTESGMRVDATNSSSGAYGQWQALPGNKMASAGADWRTNPATQDRWALGYVKGRYQLPSRAKAFHQAKGYYESGTGISGVSGDQLASLHAGEMVINKQMSDTVRALLRSGVGDDKPFPSMNQPPVSRNPSATFMTGQQPSSTSGGVNLNIHQGAFVFQVSGPMSEQDTRRAGTLVVDTIMNDSRFKAYAGS